MKEGTPNHTTQPETNALATVWSVMSAIGMDSGQHVKRSTHASKYVKPYEDCNSPTISRWMWSNRASGVAKVENGVTMCHSFFNFWHYRHVHAHLLTSEFMLVHMNRVVTRCCIAQIPGCESDWYKSITAGLKLVAHKGEGHLSRHRRQLLSWTSVIACLWVPLMKKTILVKQVLYHSPVQLPTLWSWLWRSVLHVIRLCVDEIIHLPDHFQHPWHGV